MGSDDMMHRKVVGLGIAVAVMTAMISGCSSSLADKPETANGVYVDEATNRVIVMTHVGFVEKDKERSPSYDTYTTAKDDKHRYKDKQIYNRVSNINVDSKNGIFVTNMFTGEKVTYGTYKPNEIKITQSLGIPQGTYKKTDEKIPTKEELSYNVWAVEADKIHDAGYDANKRVKSLTPYEDEMAKKIGW